MTGVQTCALPIVPYSGTTERERALLANTQPLTDAEAAEFVDCLLHQREPAQVELLSKLLLAGRGPRQILDVIQVAAAQVVVRTQGDLNFSLPQHCYEYCSTLGWFYDTFKHPQRLKLLYLAASYVNQDAWHQRNIRDLGEVDIRAPRETAGLGAAQILERLQTAVLALDGPQSVAWTQAFIETGADRAPLVERIALLATRIGNDPHNQEIPQCMLSDYLKNRAPGRDWLLLAAAQHTAKHRKYGDFLEASRRFGEAMGVAGLQ